MSSALQISGLPGKRRSYAAKTSSVPRLTATRIGNVVTVRAITSLVESPVYYHWYLDGAHVGSGTAASFSFSVEQAGQGRVEVSGLGVKIEMGPLVQAFIPLENIEKAEVLGRRARGLGVHTDFIGSLDIITSGAPLVELALRRPQRAKLLFIPARVKRIRLSLEDGQAFLSFLSSFLGKRS